MLPNLTSLSLSGKKITNAVLNVLTTRCKGMTAQLNEFPLHNDHHEANAIDQLLATMPRLRSLSLPGSVCSDGLFGRHAALVSHRPVCAHLSSWRACTVTRPRRVAAGHPSSRACTSRTPTTRTSGAHSPVAALPQPRACPC